MRTGQFHLGTSGWSYAHWAKGRFYPKGLKQGEWLAYFAGVFSTVELNMSFYRVPKAEMVTRWVAAVSRAGKGRLPSPAKRAGPRDTDAQGTLLPVEKSTGHAPRGGKGFRFAVKLWRRITHERRLRNCGEDLAFFFSVVNGFGPRRGPLLVQLPPSLRRDEGLLDDFLTELKQAAKPARWKIAVEFRHKDWLCDSVYRLLDRQRAAIVLADMPRCECTEPNDAKFVYIRRHGPGGRYRGRYTEGHLGTDAERIRPWLDAGRDVFVYFNNDVEGHAIDNALMLRELVES
jgi:uncharacterized protein YecE (DUF72 family)